MIRFNSFIQRSIRFLAAALVCVLLVFSNVYPAAAISSTRSNVTEGEANLNKIQAKTDKTAQDAPKSIEEIQRRSEGGLNEVQGAADATKMNRPENSQQATSFIDEVKGALESVSK